MLVALALSIAGMLAPFSGAAQAGAPRLIPDGQFKAESALGVAVDQSISGSDTSRGDVYVAGYVNISTNPVTEELEIAPGRVRKFDAAGNALSPPFGEAFYYSGATVNPTSGDVYVLGQVEIFGSPSVFTYDSNGALLSSFEVPASDNFFILGFPIITMVGIAADAAGNVYVPVVPSNEVLKYSPTGELLQTFTGGSGSGALKGPTGVAVDSSGNAWVVDAGNERIEELDPADVPLGEINSEGVQAVAVDPHDDVFATVHNSADSCGKIKPPCSHLVEYDPAGTQLADLGAGQFGLGKSEDLPNMVAVNDSTGRVYVSDGSNSRVFIFTPPVAPELKNEFAVEVGASGAKLGAVVNPGGISAAYRFEYGTTTAYGHAVPLPEGETSGGFQPLIVWAGVSGLQPGTTYHYRVVVTNAAGKVEGEDKTFTTETAERAACINERFRTGFSANLPDCRAYELVTPPNKSGAEPDTPREQGIEKALVNNFAAVDGSRMSFTAEDVFPGSKSAGRSYVATRHSTGWSSENVTPPKNYYGFECPDKLEINVYSTDLSKEMLQVGSDPACGGPEPEPELVSGEPKGVVNVFVRNNTDGSYQLVNVTPSGVSPTNATFVGASADLSHVVFTEEAKLTPDAQSGVANVYEWSGGAVRLLTVLPNGTPVAGAFVGISPDGSHIFFTDAGRLYARVNGAGTVQVDESRGGSGPGGGGDFVAAGAGGAQVFFTDEASAGLTADTASGSGRNLYRYDFASGELTDLTPGAHAEVQSVLGVAEDGSYVYYEAKGSLAAGATQGQPNPYLWHGGETRFIAALDKVSRERLWVSPNGAFLAFASPQSLTGYDNTDTSTGKPDPELYLYDAATNGLACASCNPSGEPPAGGPRVETDHFARNLSNNGRMFFDSFEALLPADTNNKQDVYEFEPGGVGSCADPGGCVSLISTGTGALDTWFIEANPSGNDVFLRESQKLVPQDAQEEAQRIYDVRVEGGIAEPATSSACATAETCHTASVPQSSGFGAPASQTFSGVGNVAPSPPPPIRCKKGFVKKKGKCVKVKKGKKARKTNHRGRR